MDYCLEPSGFWWRNTELNWFFFDAEMLLLPFPAHSQIPVQIATSSKPSRDTKISNLDLTITSKQDVPCLDVPDLHWLNQKWLKCLKFCFVKFAWGWTLPVNVTIVVQIIKAFEHIFEHSGNGGFIQDPCLTIWGLHFVLDYIQQTSHLNKSKCTKLEVKKGRSFLTSSSLSTSQSSSLTTKLV